VIRVWIEKNGETRLRSRITSVLDVSEAEESSTFAATPDEITKAVAEWLDAFLDDASVTVR
jgi:hypothetical protein